MSKRVILRCVFALLIVGNITQLAWNYTRVSTDVVPNEKAAVAIAKSVLVATYGEDILSIGSPVIQYDFDVTYSRLRRAWVVTGKFPPPELLDGLINGTAPVVVLRMRDGKVSSIRFR